MTYRLLLPPFMIAGLLSMSTGCGGESMAGPSELEDFPRVVSNCAGGPPSAIYMIIGLSSRVANPAGTPQLEATMRVGESVKLSIQFVGCGFAVEQQWFSTNAAVGELEPIRFGDPPGFNDAFLRAVTPGDVSVSVEFRGPDGRRHRTTTAYCDSDARYPGLPHLAGGCSNPKKIGNVKVLP